MTSLSTTMAGHHTHCDDVFARAEAAAERADWPACEQAARQFRAAVLAHFTTEEEAIFPAFEAATGMTEGPTRVMRGEHVQMRELMSLLVEAAAAADGDGFSDAAETLLLLMQQHNMKEENILYPMCDQTVAGDPAVCRAVADLVEEGPHD
ncbi:hemerythrin domain-containing protein [Denitromonas iodatirespirans]|uniref:Hemerythrin domain-containing protein n=1 Tax=Denitromonas iodatirespirans TaxID=2795389 RepID=A0A944D9M1_DENI1|nr:hemerythrin domain-containing protein [Denitromonas iodatirespirans]MBT0961257.1 hemerythrin domain-containing protein [Denitromonas iodatirespirans]